VVMLARQEIIRPDVARALLGAIDDIEAGGPEGLELDAEREGLYYNYEHAVILRTSPLIGGQMHTGRSRNDLGATIMRMRYRDVILGLIDAAVELRYALLEQAAAHVDTVMPGYTHLQPAQPITLGHYLTAIEQGLARDTRRLLGAYRHANLSPLGAAALAGTGFPIDREITSRLLGFAGLVTNTLDAVASRDYLLEALAAAAIMGATLSRFAQDLFVWYTDEFGMINFRDRVTGTSSIMPQKRNPILQEYIKGRTSQPLGAFTAAVSGVRNTNYTNVIDANREGFRAADQSLGDLQSAIVLARVAIENLIVRKELMLERCRKNFTTVTQLADELTVQWGISFRQAHEIMGSVVRQAVEKGLRATDITAEMVQEAGREELGSVRPLDPEVVARSLDPVFGVQVRSHTGGPAPAAVERMIGEARGRVRDHCDRVGAVRRLIEDGQKELRVEIDRILGSASDD